MSIEVSVMKWLIRLPSALAIVAMASQPVLAQPIANRDYTVMLHPTGNGTVVITSPAQGAKASGRGNGYVGYGLNEAGWTTFVVTGQSPFATCGDEGRHGKAKWVITGLELADTGVSVEDGNKRLAGTDFGTGVPEYVWASFPLVDRKTGVLLKADASTGQGYLQIYNYNMHPGDEGEKLVYYRLEISPCDGGDPIFADPAWGNSGRGNN